MTIQVSTPDVEATIAPSTRDRAAYLTQLLNVRSALTESAQWLQPLRDRATVRVQELALPSTRDEEWRFTDLSPLLAQTFQPSASPTQAIEQAQLEPFVLPEAANSRLVFVDGVYAPALSATASLPAEVFVGHLANSSLPETVRQQIAQTLSQQPGAEETFTALNTASLTDAAVLYIPNNQIVEALIHLLFVSTAGAEATLVQPRIWAIAGQNSSLTLVEDYVALGTGPYFTNTVLELWVEGNAQVNHTRIQRESRTAYHIGKTSVVQAADSRYTCNAISFGAGLSRHNLEVHQQGTQTETTLNGLAMIAGQQTADTHSLIAYTQPHSTSRQLHKCIVGDRAHAVFNGKVLVPQAAQLTDAGQLSKNLLLSPKARVDTKPQLEITADNVKCAHGATVSQLDSDEVFYLQSRGIDADSARQLLVYAFAYDVISQIPVASLKDQLISFVRLHQSHLPKE